MAKTKRGKSHRRSTSEMDGVYLLKLVLYVLAGSFWVKFSRTDGGQFALPIGVIIGLLFASHEHFRIDRKIEYAVLLIAMLVGYFVPYGLYVQF